VRAVAAVLAVAGLLLTGPLAGPVGAAPEPAATTLRLDLDELGPRVVTADGPGVLSVVGTVTNSGDQPVRGIAVRVQRGDVLGTEGQVRDALRGTADTDTAVAPFVELPDDLAPGASAPVRLAVPLRPSTGLGLTRPGVYELLVNVYGTVAGAERSRLAAVRMLLPVLSLPGAPPARPPAEAVPFTLLYPVVDRPRRLATVPGEATLLTDDELASSFGPDGRLYGLVAALAERAPTGSRTRPGICLVLDADLVSTAAMMRDGYDVRGPDGNRVPGTGARAAGAWLDLLATTARDGCVLALPYADADLVALTRAGLPELAAKAIVEGREVLTNALGLPALDAVSWPADGLLDERTLARAVAPQGRAVVLSADGVTTGRTTGVLPLAGGERAQLAVLADPLLTRAVAGTTGERSDPPAASGGVAAGTVAPLSTQDLIGALAFRGRTLDPGDAPLVLAPPHRWTVERIGAAALLTAVDQLIGAGLLTPRPLERAVDAGTVGAATQRLEYPLRAGAAEVTPEVTTAIRAGRDTLADLRSAAVDQGSVGVAVDDVFDPLDRGLLRAASSAWRGRPDEAALMAAAQGGRVQQLRDTVRVLEPPSPYALGSDDAPLLLTVANGLPVSLRVRIELESHGGLRVAPIPEQVVPPLGRRQVQGNAELTRSGQVSIDAVVRTPGGNQLGPTSRLRIRSTTYGTITVWLTGTAGVLLVVLAARRLWRRTRAVPLQTSRTPQTSQTSPASRTPPAPNTPRTPQAPQTPRRPRHRRPTTASAPAVSRERPAAEVDPERTTRLHPVPPRPAPQQPDPPDPPRRPPPHVPSPRR